MRRIKIVFSYDGSDFSGSQKQPNKRTIQGELERVLSKVDRVPIAVVSSGRTDRHVHAIKQVAHFDLYRDNVTLENLRYMFKRQLPKDIMVLSVEEVDKDFHARYNTVSKTYNYRFRSTKEHAATPFTTRYMTYVSEQVDIKKLNEILSEYIGVHDFTAFTVTTRREKDVDCLREIYVCHARFNDFEQCYEIIIEGNGFLHYMVRILVAFAFEVYRGTEKVEKIRELFATRDIKYVHVKAEPEGLYLADVNY